MNPAKPKQVVAPAVVSLLERKHILKSMVHSQCILFHPYEKGGPAAVYIHVAETRGRIAIHLAPGSC